MKEELKKLVAQFLQNTLSQRTEYTEEHDVPIERPPTFEEFIYWINNS